MIASVNPQSNGFKGGTYEQSDLPTGVKGVGFANVPSSGIKEARNNRGSNVRIPYARLVAVQPNIDNTGHDVSCKRAVEYDGLHNGELAWILGANSRTSHQTYGQVVSAMGSGSGVNRMQRLASTAWLEKWFEETHANVVIDLGKIRPCEALKSSNVTWFAGLAPYLAGSTGLYTTDVAKALVWVHAQTNHHPLTIDTNDQGTFVMDISPFLRVAGGDTKSISKHIDAQHGRLNESSAQLLDMPCDIVGHLTASAIEMEMRQRRLLDWSPDGIILSKLSSPSDDPMTSTELDARQAQLFNVAIQGPAITTSWTSSNATPNKQKLECQPMDRVFVCLVAELSYKLTDSDELTDAMDKRDTAHNRVVETLKRIALAKQNRDTNVTQLNDLEKVLHSHMEEAESAAKHMAGVAQTDTVSASAPNAPTSMHDHLEATEKLRAKDLLVDSAKLTKFRLLRSTSSHMINHSHFKSEDKNSRCQLKFEPYSKETNSGCAEYIVGAWCVGTVLDSAASRSSVGMLVRRAPSSMAMNVNVNVEWWSAKKLYEHFMDGPDDENRILMRTQTHTTHNKRPRESYTPNARAVVAQSTRKQSATAASMRSTRVEPRVETMSKLEALLAAAKLDLDTAEKKRVTADKSEAAADTLLQKLCDDEKNETDTDVKQQLQKKITIHTWKQQEAIVEANYQSNRVATALERVKKFIEDVERRRKDISSVQTLRDMRAELEESRLDVDDAEKHMHSARAEMDEKEATYNYLLSAANAANKDEALRSDVHKAKEHYNNAVYTYETHETTFQLACIGWRAMTAAVEAEKEEQDRAEASRDSKARDDAADAAVERANKNQRATAHQPKAPPPPPATARRPPSPPKGSSRLYKR